MNGEPVIDKKKTDGYFYVAKLLLLLFKHSSIWQILDGILHYKHQIYSNNT